MFAGTPRAAVPSLQLLLNSVHEIAAVITRPDAPAGRGRTTTRSEVAEFASEHGIELLQPPKPADPEFLDRLREIAPDCCPIVAYGALLPQSALDIPRLGWLNLHFSLLPAWRGAAPVQHAILHGDQITGASVFVIEPSLDTGPVYGQLTEPITDTDTSGDLLARLAKSGAGLLLSCLDGIADGVLRPVPQSTDGVSVAPKLTGEDARVTWQHPAYAVDRQIRACTPAPGAWSTLRGQRLKLGPVSVAPDATDLSPGQLWSQRHRVLIGTATSAVELSAVQPAGRRTMPALDWVRGLRPPLNVGGDAVADEERFI